MQRYIVTGKTWMSERKKFHINYDINCNSSVIEDAIIHIEASHFEGQQCDILAVNIQNQLDLSPLQMHGRATFNVR
jgi:hypothetical protein